MQICLINSDQLDFHAQEVRTNKIKFMVPPSASLRCSLAYDRMSLRYQHERLQANKVITYKPMPYTKRKNMFCSDNSYRAGKTTQQCRPLLFAKRAMPGFVTTKRWTHSSARGSTHNGSPHSKRCFLAGWRCDRDLRLTPLSVTLLTGPLPLSTPPPRLHLCTRFRWRIA